MYFMMMMMKIEILCNMEYLYEAEGAGCGLYIPFELHGSSLQGVHIDMLNLHRQEVYLRQARLFSDARTDAFNAQWVITSAGFPRTPV